MGNPELVHTQASKMMNYFVLALAITAISAQHLDGDLDNFLDESMDLPCTPKPCVPICKPTTKYLSFGAFKLPYTENVCVPDKKCEAANAACIKTLQAAMKDAAAKEAALKAASATKSKAGASKAAKDKAAVAKKAVDLAKAAFTKAEQEAAAAKAASVAADKSSKAKDAIMQKALGVYEGEKKNHLAAVAAYDGAKSDAAKAAAAYDAAVNAHCTAEAQHAAAVRKIGHGHLAQKNCAKYTKRQAKIEFHGKKHARKSYADLAGECAKKGMRLPTWSELCPKGKGSTPTGGKTADADMWTPIVGQSNGNKWVQIGGRHGGTCNPLSTYHGSRGHWMESRRATHYKGVYGCIKAPLPKGHIEFHGKKHARKSYADLAGECAKKGMR